jgi:hypothetical protein
MLPEGIYLFIVSMYSIVQDLNEEYLDGGDWDLLPYCVG